MVRDLISAVVEERKSNVERRKGMYIVIGCGGEVNGDSFEWQLKREHLF
ncbi:hypothetical protein A2U01_0073577 [Trifolium medium]|uniref:Uncharacterized protein n=1 Tax=Trifolium medium TaxID=97028 RepID=A0A392SU16_9FABA|nr:hypothetical protein [Trifolium medium]